MKLLKYLYLEEEELYEFYYEHKHAGVLQELIFRHPMKEPGYSVYRTWLMAGNTQAEEHVQKEVMKQIEEQVKLQDEMYKENSEEESNEG